MALAEFDPGRPSSVLSDRGPHLDSTSHDQLPAAASLSFPPFPLVPSGVKLVPFRSFDNDGVRIRCDDLAGPSHLAGRPNGISPVPLANMARNVAERSAHRQARKSRRLLRGKLGAGVERHDCWKIGGESADWKEPENTSMSDYRQSIPPFTRLMSAVRDFLYSRHEEFQYNRSKRLFELMRISLGLRVEFAGNHWPGTGADAETYQMPRNAGEFGTAVSAHQETEGFGSKVSSLGPPENEVCVLLRCPETCVRGLLALARREAEAGWDLEPAVQMAEITSAFLAFVEYHHVLPEAELREGFKAALQLARTAPRQLREAKGFEDELLRPASWNAALWVAYGRSWGHPPRKGKPEPEESARGSEVNEADRVDDGGWTVQINTSRKSELTFEQALEHLSDFLWPLAVTSIEVLQNIPYHRRRITEVLPPLEPLPGTPLFMTRLHRIVTEPAPWTPEEKWRVHRRQHDEVCQQDDDDEGAHPAAEWEEEAASMDFSGSITIWANVEEYGASKEALIGMGLRGRWAMMGPRDAQANAWWTFKPKDFILPSFWQSETAVRRTANHAHAIE